MVRNSHQDAPNEREFDRLLEATTTLEYPFNIECRWILIAGGRLGMRAGEISHMKEDWIDWDRKQIHIPAFEDCRDGRDGDVCGYCKKAAKQAAGFDADLSLEDALDERWNPKTANSIRAIPFDFSDFVENNVIAFWRSHDCYPHSRVSINRRVTRLAEAAGMRPESVYPHCLRAGAATWHAYRGLPAAALQSLFGWSNLAVAQKYLRLSGGATADALRAAHQS